MKMKNIHVIHILICFIYSKIFELGILVSGVSTVWEDTNVCENQYRCDLDIYLINVLSYLYVIIMDCVINAPCHVNNFVDGLNSTDKLYLRG